MIHFINVGNGDSILIQSMNKDGYKHILIDGGTERNAHTYSVLKKEILSVIDHGRIGVLDLVIVTHSDDDHIGGVLKLVGDPVMQNYIKKYVFHAEKYIAQKLNKEYSQAESYNVNIRTNETVKSGYKQDIKLTDILDKNNNVWDKCIYLANDIIKIGDAKLVILSPTKEKLEILQSFWEKEKDKLNLNDINRKSNTLNRDFDYTTKFKDFSFDENSYKEETSETNGASIAFIYEEVDFKALLLADAHPSIIVKSLTNLLKPNESKYVFNVVKLSHHGSISNISPELLDLIDCKNFVISANADRRYRHPNKETLALILKHYGESNVNFYFTNDNSKLREIFENESFKNFFFPKKGDHKITIPYDEN